MAKYNYKTKEISKDLAMFTKGMLFKLPIESKWKTLFDDLKEKGFIANETRIEDFCVVLGRYLHNDELPFEKIRWLKDLQLFRFFLENVTPDFPNYERSIMAGTLFLNKSNKMNYPNRIPARLKTRNSYDVLETILKKYKL